MSFFSRLCFISRNRRKPLSRSPDDRIYVIDASGLASGRGRRGNSQPGPRDHVFILKNLAQFVSKEGIRMVAIFTGHSLKEAPEGSFFKEIKVHYVNNAGALKKKIEDIVRKNRRTKDIVVLTSNVQIEHAAVAQGAACMRLSTLKRVLEDKEERGRTYRRKSSRERPADSQQHKENISNSSIRDSAVLNLIDPV